MNLSTNKYILPNLELVKQEVPETDDVFLTLVDHEIGTIKSETISTESKFEPSSKNTLDPEVIRNPSLEVQSDTRDRYSGVESNANTFVKQELLHEELDIKCEDETAQENCLEDKYNWDKPRRYPSEVKHFKCNICSKSYGRRSVLKTHLITHTGEKPFKCNICEYSSAQKCSLKTHLRTHTREKPFKCNICDYSCAHNGDLKRHIRTHTGEKPFKCNICDYSCAQNGHFNRHLSTHTGEKPFKCNICVYCCLQHSNLKRHLRTHTGEKPFKVQFLCTNG